MIKKIITGGQQVQRQSNFELLRLLCIFGIISMHTFGTVNGTVSGANLVFGVLINSIFNTCVSLFVLISGFFGISGTVKKYLKLELEVLFYSVLSYIVVSVVQGHWDLRNLGRAVFPVFSERYWYITSYMLLLLFSKYINQIPEKLKKEDFEKLLLLMFFVFSVVPTVVQYHVMGDGGKGFANMLLMYFVGRYIRLYWKEEPHSKKKTIALGAGVILLGFILNLVLTLLRQGKGVCAPFARDCSCIIIIASVSIFMAFKKIRMTSNVINQIAKHVVSVYLFEGAMRTFFNQFFDITLYADKWYFFAVLSAYVLVVIEGCMILDVIRSILAKPIENMICLAGEKGINRIAEGCEKLRSRYKSD